MKDWALLDTTPNSRVPPVRPSLIFWAMLAATAAAFIVLYLHGDDGFTASGAYSPGRNIQISIFVFVALGWGVALVLHEAAHATIAWMGGDHTVEDKGYLNLDPRKYTSPLLSLGLPLLWVIMGGIPLPGGAVWINHSLIRSREMRSLMSAAGPAMNLLAAIVVLMPLKVGLIDPATHTALASGLAFLGFLNIGALMLNLLPVPGFDGFGILEPHLSPQLLETLAPVRRWGIMVVLLALWQFPSVNRAFFESVFWIFDLFDVNSALISEGYDAFQFWE